MKLLTVIFFLLSSLATSAIEIEITSPAEGEHFPGRTPRINLSGSFHPGQGNDFVPGSIKCDGKAGSLGGGRKWQVTALPLTEAGVRTISCTYTKNGQSVTDTVTISWVGPNILPSPSFTWSPQNSKAPTSLTFDASPSTDPDGNISSYSWELGDGTTKTGKVVQHHYASGGTYNVRLKVVDNEGGVSYKNHAVVVRPPNTAPSAVFILTPTGGKSPLNVNFDATLSSDQDGTLVSFNWDFGDGTSGTGPTPSHRYENPGSFFITLTVQDDDGAIATHRKSLVVIKNQPPVARGSVTPTSGETPLQVTFDLSLSTDGDGTIQGYRIDFGDGTPEVTSSIPFINHLYETEGTFFPVIRVVDDNSEASEPLTLRVDSFIPNLPPVAKLTATPTTGYSPLRVQLSGLGSFDPDGSIASYQWSFPDGTSLFGPEVEHFITGVGEKIVTLTVKDDRNVATTTSVTITLSEDTDTPSIAINPGHGSLIRTSTPQFEITHTDITSGINLGSIKAYVDGINLTHRLQTAPGRSFLPFTLEFPIAQGDHEIRIELADNAGNPAILVQNFRVDLGIISTSYIVGKLEDEYGEPLSGVTISEVLAPLGMKLNLKTKLDGSFKFPIAMPGTYRLSFNKQNYLESVRTATPAILEDYDMGTIRLAEADSAIVQVPAGQAATASNSTGTLTAIFEPGDLPVGITFNSKEYTSSETMPGPLPVQSAFTYAFDMRPQQINFSNNGVEVLLENHLNFPIGTEIVYGSFDRELGRWLDTGRSVPVIASSKTRNGTAVQLQEPFFVTGDPNVPFLCRAFGSCNPPSQAPAPSPNTPPCDGCCGGGGFGSGFGGGAGGPGAGLGSQTGYNGGWWAAGSIGGGTGKTQGCEIDNFTGDLSVDHELPSIKSANESHTLRFRYHSRTIQPKFFLSTELVNGNPDPADYIEAKLNVAGKTLTKRFRGDGEMQNTVYRTFLEAKNPDNQYLPTGIYQATNELTVAYSNSEYATATFFGGPPRARLGVLARVPLTFSSRSDQDAVILNRMLSPFGGGWSIDGLEKLHVSASGKVLRELGNNDIEVYTPTAPVSQLSSQKLNSRKSRYPVKFTALAAFDGLIYGADCENNQIFRISTDGGFEVIAGSGEKGFTGDGGPATHASFDCPVALAKAETGGIYVADRDNFRIRRIWSDGRITTIAKHSKKPLSVSEDIMRAVYFTTEDEVMFVNPRGGLETYAAADRGYIEADLDHPSQVYFNHEAYPVVVDKNHGRIITLYPQNGSIETLFGSDSSLKVNLDGKLKPRSMTYDPVTRTRYILSDAGKVYQWIGGELREIGADSQGGILEKKFLRQSSKISALAFSPETGLVLASGEKILFAKRTRGKKSVQTTYSSQAFVTSALKRLENGSFELTELNKVKRIYDDKGQITGIIRPDGKNTFFRYSGNLLREVQYQGGASFNLNYDSRGYLNSVTDSANRQTTFEVNDLGELIRIDGPEGATKEYTYSQMLLQSERKEDGEFTEFTYRENEPNRIQSEKKSGNRIRNFKATEVTATVYTDGSGPADTIRKDKILSTADVSHSGDCTLSFFTNDQGSMTKMVDCLGHATNYSPDATGMFNTVSSPENRQVSRTFDAKRRPTSESGAWGTRSYTYDPIWNKTASITDSRNFKVQMTYNQRGLVETMTDEKNRTTFVGYNEIGNPTLIRDALMKETILEYDQNQNLERITDPLGLQIEMSRDAAGNISSLKDTGNRITNFEYDGQNRLTGIFAPLDYTTFLAYTPQGKLKRVTNANNKSTEFDYDPQSYKVSMVTQPNGQTEQYLYDLNDRLSQKINKDETVINYRYDLMGRLKEKSSASIQNVFSYDKDGLLITASNTDALITFNHDQHGRLITSESSHAPGTLSYTYDDRGLKRRMNLRIGNSSVLSATYTYDERKLLTRISANLLGHSVVWDRYWDDLSRPDTDIVSAGIKTQREYDDSGRLTLLSHEYSNGNPLSRFELDHNPSGTIKEIMKSFMMPLQNTVGQLKLSYSYDDLDRLIFASTDGSFSYDIMGNHLQRGGVHNDLNQLEEDADNTYVYTTNGHLQTKTSKTTGERTEYTWSVEGRVFETRLIRGDGTLKSVVTNVYDALDRRIIRASGDKVTKYIYDDQAIIAEFNDENDLKALYLHGPGIDEPIAMLRDVNNNGSLEEKELYFYFKDHLNSVHDLTDNKGRPVQRYNYSAYGRTTVEKTSTDLNAKIVQSPFGYTSREWEQENGDYYYRFRNYDPRTGRFLSEDPIGFLGGDTNLFRYVAGNPVSIGDPFGLLVERCQRPLKGFEDIIGPIYHDFVCVNGYCNGLTAGGRPFFSKGVPSNDDRKDARSCKTVPSSNPQCFEACIEQKLRDPSRPFYSPTPIGSDCQEFATETIVNCYTKCGQ